LSADNVPEDFWREPLPPKSTEIDPALPDDDPLLRGQSDLGLSGDVWADDDQVGFLGRTGPTTPEPSISGVVFEREDDTWMLPRAAPEDVPARTGATPPPATQVFPGRGSRRPPSWRRPGVLAALVALGAVASVIGLRALGSEDAGSGRTGAAAVAPVPTSPPIPAPTTVVRTAPAVTTTSSTTSTTSTTAPPPSTTTSTPATTRAPATARSAPTTSVRAGATTSPGPATGIYGPLCGFLPGSTVAIDLNGVPAQTQIAGPDGCVSGTVVVAG
jgi:hypothetical protein